MGCGAGTTLAEVAAAPAEVAAAPAEVAAAPAEVDCFVLRDKVIGRCSVLHEGASPGRELLCNFFRPHHVQEPLPCVIVIYGGGWVWGDRSQLEHFCVALVEQGYAAVACEYRLSQESPWPGMINDVKQAIRWTRRNANELSIHPDRIGVFGASAGGHLASLCAGNNSEFASLEGNGGDLGVSSAVKAAVALYPWTSSEVNSPPEMQAKFDQILTGLRVMPIPNEFCPIRHVCADSAPVAFIHGTKDPTNPCEHSVKMHEALLLAGIPSELHLIAEQGRSCRSRMLNGVRARFRFSSVR